MRYRAYGLTLACARELPFAEAEGGGAADVTIHDELGQAPRNPSAKLLRELRRDGEAWSLRYRNPEGGWLHFDHDPATMRLTIAGSVDWSDAVPVLAGVACAVLLSSQGTPLLHGAAVAFAGEAIGIMGASGQGKSTLAAGLLEAGGSLLSEDLLVVSPIDQAFKVEPGYARISLLPDSYEALADRSGNGSAGQPRSGTGKSWIDAAAAVEPLPVRRLYVLAPPDPAQPEGRIKRLPRIEATAALVRQLYGVSWIRAVNQADLALCGWLAARVPVSTLSRPATLGDVAACAAILRTEHTGDGAHVPSGRRQTV